MVLCLVVGCRDSAGNGTSDTWQGSITTSGDTTFVHTQSGSVLGDLGTIPSESLEVVYAGEGVLRSTAVATAGDKLLIGERTQIVEIGAPGEVETLGRKGDGPGEFRRILGVHARGDTVEALDFNASRLTRFGPDHVPITTTLEAPTGYDEAMASSLASCDGNILALWRAGYRLPGGPPDTVAIVWWRPNTKPVPWLLVEDVAWTATQPSGTRRPYGVRALVASDGGCQVATSDGVTFAAQIRNASNGAMSIITVDEAAVPVTADAKTIPEKWQGEFPSGPFPPLIDLVEGQDYGDTRDQVEELQFDAGGRLWMRVVDSTYKYHPFVMGRVAEARPATYRWDVFGTDGRRLATVHLPSNFTPKAWSVRWVYGIAEDDDGALVVGRLPVLEELQ